MQVCVTGANGFIGRYLVGALSHQGHSVRVLTRQEGDTFPADVEVVKGDLTSLDCPLDQFLRETIALCAPLHQRLQHAQLVSPVEATGNFSYVCDRTHGGNYLLLGDAYTFIDPVFSSGVMLAMQSAFVGADTVDTCLRHPQQGRPLLAVWFES